ncbi:MAG: NYN domain-containing protein [Thioalkalivibrio sp.]|nr:NYN domain-containing protein [Thioalkalivibrio sp.]
MNTPYLRAPHQGGASLSGASSPHAALLIDFDNVTMGMRSDLSKELKTLLDSDVIKGKVSVQRAYADWRRYPQYIVPLSEASVDLIFAPAYGSNKKNATDIRMAIDALELVFIRPEIGTYILLTGDSDFSSLVLKLKEYGKYVIGVGIQESSSDILVQNCDEYYSYTSLTGLTKTTDLHRGGSDPWVLVKDALAKMVQRDDVMRSDRLKQVMLRGRPRAPRPEASRWSSRTARQGRGSGWRQRRDAGRACRVRCRWRCDEQRGRGSESPVGHGCDRGPHRYARAFEERRS